MKKLQILMTIGVFCSSLLVADEETLLVISDNVIHKEEITKPKKIKNRKKKHNMSLAFNVCIRAIEETFKDLLNKELSHILNQLPKWIERLGTRIVPMGDPEGTMTPHNILEVLQFVKNTSPGNPLFEKKDSYLKKLLSYDLQEDRINYLVTILSSYDESLLFFDELFYVLSSSLSLIQKQQVEAYYLALSEKTELSLNHKEPKMKNDKVLSDYGD